MRWTFDMAGAALVAALQVSLVACGPLPSGLPDFEEVACGESSDATINVTATAFDPATVTVVYADVVQWSNADIEERTVRSGHPEDDDAGSAFDSGPLAAGASYCVQARDLGDHPFFEVGGATGSLEVESPPDDGGGDDSGYDDPYMGY